MPHELGFATTGRSKCRGCGQAIKRDELRFGERVPNAFGEGEATLWFHPLCAAYKRPESLLETVKETAQDLPDRESLQQVADRSLTNKRLQRIDGAERSPTGQAKCRCCQEPITKGSWRIRIVYYEEGRFAPGGFIHLACRNTYFETQAPLEEQVLHFSPALTGTDRQELIQAFDSEPLKPAPPPAQS